MIITQKTLKTIYDKKDTIVTFLPILLTSDCNANCKACIAKHNFKNDLCKYTCQAYDTCKSLRCSQHTTDDETFYSSLNSILEIVKGTDLYITITGGEPTLSNRFFDVLDLLDNYNISRITMETNGSNLANPKVEQYIKKHNIQILLSRYTFDELENGREFDFSSHKLSNQDLQQLAGIYGDQLTISTIVLKKFINSSNKLLSHIENFSSIGIKNFEFVQFMADPTLRDSNRELLEYWDKQAIDLKSFRDQLADYRTGGFTDEDYFWTESYKKDDISFQLSAANMEKQATRPLQREFKRFLILPSGEISLNGVLNVD